MKNNDGETVGQSLISYESKGGRNIQSRTDNTAASQLRAGNPLFLLPCTIEAPERNQQSHRV